MPGVPLVVEHAGRRWRLHGPTRVGRGSDAEVHIEDELVSRWHVRLTPYDEGWLVEDLGSTNGTWLDGAPLVSSVLREETAELRLGAPDGALLRLQPGLQPAREAVPARRDLLIGRGEDCDLVLDDPQVSRHHARISRAGEAVLSDLSSFNGTFHNGHPITRPVVLTPGDQVDLGSQTLTWDGDSLGPRTAPASLRIDRLQVRTRAGKALLQDVSLTFAPRSLTGVIGPSGAGKSTLLGALTGDRPAQGGHIRWQGHDLHQHYENLRHHIGLVPQDDIVHPQLKVAQALRYAAVLRLPPDTSEAETRARVDSVLERMQLTPQADQSIGRTLSGGQRKRVSIAMELITAPPLLFLDEPTSGLDPALDREVMVQLRQLADEGRVVVTVTHSVQALELCDQVVVLAPGGTVAYAGPPTGVFAFFGVEDYVGVFRRLAEPDRVASTPSGSDTDGAAEAGQTGSLPTPSARAPYTRQLRTLVARNVAVLGADRGFLTLLAMMPLVLALLARVVPGGDGLSLDAAGLRGPEATQRLTILTVGGALMGTALTVREMVRERVIWDRERAVGVSVSAYWTSKVLVFGLLGLAQGLVFGVMALLGLPGPDDGGVLGLGRWGVIVPLAAATMATAVIGLLLSLVVRTSEQAMPALVGATMVQLVLSGALLAVNGRAVLEQVAWLAPARWSYVAAAVATGLDRRPVDSGAARDPLLHVSGAQWAAEVVLLLVLTVLYAVLGWLAMQRSARPRR